MTANIEPIFTDVPVIGIGLVSAANTDRSAGTGTMSSILVADADGTRVTRITIQAVVTTTAGIVRLWIYNGANYRLWKEIAVTPITVSATQVAFSSIMEFLGERAILLPDGYALFGSTENAQAFNVIAEGGHF
jgi:hypothetical protein